MLSAISHDCTLCLNQGNHPSIPPEGLVLEAGRATPVSPEQAEYLKALGVDVQGAPEPSKKKPAKED